MAACLWKRAESQDRSPGTLSAARPYHVYDHEGTHLGSFADWDVAHEWAHLQVALSALPAPLELEDRRRGTRRQVWADHCEPSPAAGPEPRAAQDDVTTSSQAGRDETHTGSRVEQRSGVAPRTTPTAHGAPTPRAVATSTVLTTESSNSTPETFTPPRPRRPS